MTARAILSGLLLSLLFGCGGGGSNNSVNGTVRGKSMQAVDAIAGTGAGAAIALSSSGGICGKVSAGQQPKSTQFLIFILQDVAGQQASAPTAPGTYPITQSGAKQAGAVYIQTDANCQNVVGSPVTAISGTVTLTSVSNGSYSGNFDLTLDSNDHISGSFSAANCPGLVTFLTLMTTTCV